MNPEDVEVAIALTAVAALVVSIGMFVVGVWK